MALAERIVLFHDRAAAGPGHPESTAAACRVLRGVVPLPHARARLLLDDAPRMAVFARRFAPGPLRPAGERHPDRHRRRRQLAAGHAGAGRGRARDHPWRQPDHRRRAAAARRKLAINRLRERRPLEPAAVDRFLARHEVPDRRGRPLHVPVPGRGRRGPPRAPDLRAARAHPAAPAARHRPVVRGAGTARRLPGRVPARDRPRRAARAHQRPAEPAPRAQPAGQFLGLLRPGVRGARVDPARPGSAARLAGRPRRAEPRAAARLPR